MLIRSIKAKNRKGFLYLVEIDETTYELTEDVLVSFRLSKNMELDEKTLRSVLFENDKSLCVNALVSSLTLKTEKEFRERLFHKGFSRAAVDHAIEYGKKHGLVDDARFAERYYEKNASKKSVALIRHELKQKGVSSTDLFFLSDEEDDDDAVVELAQKYVKNKEKTPENRLRLMRHLASKGFSYATVRRATSRIFGADDDE